jgi:regulator of chromosome condensation
MTAKKPFELTFFRTKQLKIVKIAVGGLHTLALTTRGEVYSWGCNDDGALGRKTLDEESAE